MQRLLAAFTLGLTAACSSVRYDDPGRVEERAVIASSARGGGKPVPHPQRLEATRRPACEQTAAKKQEAARSVSKWPSMSEAARRVGGTEFRTRGARSRRDRPPAPGLSDHDARTLAAASGGGQGAGQLQPAELTEPRRLAMVAVARIL